MRNLAECTRCGGFTVPEMFRDVGFSSIGWHCLICGEVVDEVILKNRTHPAPVFEWEEPGPWMTLDCDGDLGGEAAF